MKTLEGKIALITGASRGIGLATAKRFVEAGASVMMVGRTLLDLRREAAELRCHFVVADVSKEVDVAAAFDSTREQLGPVDILVNNAGIIACAPVAELSAPLWDEIIGVNLRGAFLCSRQAFLHMSGRGGCIINVSSLGGIKGTEKFPGYSAYTAAKSGVVGLTEALAVEGRPAGIRVNGIAPGAVNTDMLRKAAPELRSQTSPDDVAEVILFLAEPRSDSLNGAMIEIHSNL